MASGHCSSARSAQKDELSTHIATVSWIAAPVLHACLALCAIVPGLFRRPNEMQFCGEQAALLLETAASTVFAPIGCQGHGCDAWNHLQVQVQKPEPQ